MKVLYSPNGLSVITKFSLGEARTNLNKAKVTLKNDFPYLNYLNALSGKIDKYIDSLDRLQQTIQNIDSNYDNLEEELLNHIDKIDVYKIKERKNFVKL